MWTEDVLEIKVRENNNFNSWYWIRLSDKINRFQSGLILWLIDLKNNKNKTFFYIVSFV